MSRNGYFEENEMRLAEARLHSLAQAPWKRTNVSPAGWHEDVYADHRDIVLLFAGVLRHPRCDPARLVWGPENEPFKVPGDGGYIADACNAPWYGTCRRQSGGGGCRRAAARPRRQGAQRTRGGAAEEHIWPNINLLLAK